MCANFKGKENNITLLTHIYISENGVEAIKPYDTLIESYVITTRWRKKIHRYDWFWHSFKHWANDFDYTITHITSTCEMENLINFFRSFFVIHMTTVLEVLLINLELLPVCCNTLNTLMTKTTGWIHFGGIFQWTTNWISISRNSSQHFHRYIFFRKK